MTGAGVMTWEVRTRISSFSQSDADICIIKFPDAETTWISAVRSTSFA